MDFIELTILPSDVNHYEIISAHMAEIGFEGFLENEVGEIKTYIRVPSFTDELRFELSKIKSLFPFEYIENYVKHENWNSTWEKSFKPVIISEECIVRASFHEIENFYKYNLVIDPKMAFGTAHHETTFLMLTSILSNRIEGKSVADLGTGTGILAILANKKNARTVFATDIDINSIENATENAIKNQCSQIEFNLGGVDLIAGRKFDMILANINLNVLLEEIPQYVNSLNKGGEIYLSGFFESDIPILKSKLILSGLTFKAFAVKNKWAMLCFNS